VIDVYSLSIVGKREVIVKSTGEDDIQYKVLFSGLPEPSLEQMDEILNDQAPVKAYVEWLRDEAKYYTYTNGLSRRNELANQIEREAHIHLHSGWKLSFTY
jgi:hypothetical protein